MNIWLDACLPQKFTYEVPDHVVRTGAEQGWFSKHNGELLRLTAQAFDVCITADQTVTYQQNLSRTPLHVIVLVAANKRVETLRPLMPNVQAALPPLQPGLPIMLRLEESY